MHQLATLAPKSYDFPFGAAAAATYMELLSPTPLSIDHVEEEDKKGEGKERWNRKWNRGEGQTSSL